ncbi:hypothetical protein EGT07_07845 [Herbaspirillum sp. HC18]|nr:hypothetical protein EGT07_07845 [Herbaspirillum sp. HC18]
MTPQTRGILLSLREMLADIVRLVERVEKELATIPGILRQLAWMEESITSLKNRIDDVLLNASETVPHSGTFSKADIRRLRNLNQHLTDITAHLHATFADITPPLDTKCASPDDPMYDYEVVAKISYVLRDDDPAFANDEDNILAIREEIPESLPDGIHIADDFCEASITLARIYDEPHCWLFHDLYDHRYGADQPALSLRDCLRIGRIYIDVQVWQQYCFDLQRGKWLKVSSGFHAES